ncbi:MAG: subtilisin family serine protease [Myxococcota bacterium]|jgi:subtilisin family serine protease
MTWLVFATSLLDPLTLFRVDDPHHPDALWRSATGAVIEGRPPAGVPHRYAVMAELDSMPAVEALEVTNADLWHADGLTGAGVKIAVFDIGWYGPEADVSELGEYIGRDCVLHPSCEAELDLQRPREGVETGVHGIGCAEVVRDLAPGAELYLVRTNGLTAFENGVAWAVREGIDIITMSMSFYNASFYDGGGPFAPLIADLASNDILLVTSAGNNARAHWFGRFVDADLDGRLDGDGDNGLWTYQTAGAKTFYVNWNQHGRCGDTDLDVKLVDVAGGERTIVGWSRDVQDRDGDQCEPVERLRADVPREDWYRLEVEHVRGAVTDVSIDIIGRSGSILDSMPDRSVSEPGVHAGTFTVGAVRASEYLSASVEDFSSWGPTHGGLSKPDIAGPDGLSTSAYGPEGFFGTSASTPAVAALVALVMEDDPSLTPAQAAVKLQAWALGSNVGFSAPDPRWGAGKARLPLRTSERGPCGRRPLILPVVLLPVWWRRRRRRARPAQNG